MLDLLQAIKDERGPGVAVEAEPPQFRQYPRVGGVPAIDRQLDRLAGRVVPGEPFHPPGLVRRPGNALDGDAQVGAQPAISRAEGRPSGDPATRCSPAATPHPIARLETVLTGSADPVTTAAIDASVTSDATSRCSGRLR